MIFLGLRFVPSHFAVTSEAGLMTILKIDDELASWTRLQRKVNVSPSKCPVKRIPSSGLNRCILCVHNKQIEAFITILTELAKKICCIFPCLLLKD